MYAVLSPVASSPHLGANLLPGGAGAAFRVWAPNASAVNVRLSPDAATPPTVLPLGADPAQPGYWSADVSGVAAGHRYQFDVTNKGGDPYNPGGLPLLRVDPCARQVTSSDRRKPGLIVDPGVFAFNTPFATPRFEDFIIYQAHVGSFAGRNDGLAVTTDANGGTANFDQFRAKLDYVRGMNFSAIQFLPTGEYRGTEGEAYNPSNFYAPEVLYGTPDDLRRLVDACHARGLAVILDVVYNHMDGGDNLWQFDGNSDHRSDESDPQSGGGIYFSRFETGFGRRPDHDSPDVRRFFTDNAAMWFREYRVDGLRFDSVANFSADGLKAIVGKLAADFPDKLLIAEDSDPGYVFGTLGFDACWDMGSADDFARAVGGRDLDGLRGLIDRPGYPANYGAVKYLLGSHDQIFNVWKSDNGRDWYWDKGGGGGLRENRFFVERVGGPMTGRDNWYARAQARLGWALTVAARGTPMLFMGSECHHYGYWNAADDPFGDHRFDWSIAGDATGQPMRDLVRDANAVRRANPALRSAHPPLFSHFDPQNGVLGFRRWDDAGNVVFTVVNLGDGQWDQPVYGVNVAEPDSRWEEVFNSQAPQYGGWADSGNYLADLQAGPDGRFSVRLPKWSVLMFRKR
jgi:1,4-alpha-glucan branching enzyme